MSEPTTPWTLTARWVFPIDQPPLEHGTVTINGKVIVAVNAHGDRRPDVDLGNVAVLPGLVNAHTHLDLTGLCGQAPPSPDFTAWLRQVIAHRRSRTPEQVREDIWAGLADCLHFGTTLVGDISGDGGSWDALAEAPLRAVVFHELLGLPRERAVRAWMAFQQWLREHPSTPTCRPGVSPHAPYSVRADLIRAAASTGLPLTIHLAESRDELELLEKHSGPFVSFLTELGVWEPGALVKGRLFTGPERVLKRIRHVATALIAHGNYLPPSSATSAGASIVYCPRTHAAFGHPPHPFREFLKRGIRVALGTDSLASNPDLDLLAEMRFLHARHSDVPGGQVLRMGTLSGAEALGWGDETGSLTPGKSADLVVLPLAAAVATDPHWLVLESDLQVSKVVYRGHWIQPRSV
jgi:cytosine/adenosine deaminase-related metal-dependent hydrolase